MSDATTAEQTKAEQTKSEKNGERELTCFVVIGFGKKTDYATGRVLDLDLTYSKLIKPAFEAAGIQCFRAIDVNVSGSIDVLMYRWIFQADFVVADLSTMNANVFYELGVRYAQKPSTTLIMAENGIFEKLPFDLSHTIIYGYEHLGEEIADAEVERFVPLLTRQIEKLKADPPVSPGDSPVFTYLQGMKVPEWRDATERIAELEEMLAGREQLEAALESGTVDMEMVQHQAISALLDTAEEAKNRKDYPTAIALYKAAIDNAQKSARAAEEAASEATVGPQPKVKIDVSLWQRLALVTYKQVEKHDPDDPAANQEAIEALEEAMAILNRECDAKVSTDPETLGLSGAVNKRLYERTGERKYFKRSVGFYERGFYIKQDHYNGINVAFMYTMDAARLAEQGETFDAIVNYGHANIIRAKVAEICEDMIADSERFARLKEPEWVYQSLWEAYFGMGRLEAAEELEPTIENVSPDFAIDTWHSQREKLGNAIGRFKELVDLDGGAAPVAPPAEVELVDQAPVLAQPEPTVTRRRGEPISVDLGDLRDRRVRSVEVKVEFSD